MSTQLDLWAETFYFFEGFFPAASHGGLEEHSLDAWESQIFISRVEADTAQTNVGKS
jgi:hypothetical protein